ncbi:hypothetical protein [Shewanella algae]|uniref:hypothetical protein n=1 Tax=Shewanella algae TaxID=38313 RepID=UPI001182BDC2|nr:hypothetical protein [Shewanella algae]MBO2674776.1 hypothetical protein [Shewanella algae]TVL15441.1 hypothetical protein AYJ02_10220 [Shewanella algae]
MPERLELTKNAQFYIPKNTIDDSIINDILGAAVDNMDTGAQFVVDLFRADKRVDESDLEYKCSVRVFPSVRPVYFIDEELEDRVYAFIILIEYQNYLAILKKSCANISELLKEHFALVDSRDLTSTFGDNDVEFQKIALRNMTISDRAMRARSYEAADLKGLLSTHSAGRSIPFYLKLRQGAITKTISGTGRLVESSQRKSLDEIAVWVKEQVELIENPSNDNNFLDSFAKKVELSDVLNACEPNAILVESTPLQERIERDGLTLKYKTARGVNVVISSRIKNKLFAGLERVYELDSECKVIGKENCTRLRKNEKSLTLTSKALTKFRVIENGKEVTLQKFIVKNGYYSVTFTDPKYMYFMGACFEDSSGISEINSILEIMHPKVEMSTVTSEKGGFTNTSTAFEVDSMFGVVESLHQNDDYIFCDDLGIEWADHITLNRSESNISFIHSKHGSTSTSASNLHDVVGQGIKNLGNMYFTKEQMLERINGKFSDTYSNNGCNTSIARIRKGDPAQAEGYLDGLLKDYKLHRKCILSCSFISKSSVITEFSKIQRGESVPGHIIQLLWIISSFAHAVRDMNAIPIIYCAD